MKLSKIFALLLALCLISSAACAATFTDAHGNVIELDDPGFDGVSLGRRGEDTFLVLWQGRVVLYVGAFGVTGVEKHLDEYADVLAQFQ